ncbi:cell surface glycoprotein CD200 receptor 1-A [Aplochiton taeniatus]
MLFTIWKIDLNDGERCELGSSNDDHNHSSCNDGKVLLNTSNGAVHLHIPHFTKRDEGVYSCESAYIGGVYSAHINVSLIAPPNVSAWLEREGNQQVAVCLAAGGKPAASVVWRGLGNSSAATVQIRRYPNGSVESRLVLPGNMTSGNLTCAVSHPSWTEEHTQRLEIHREASMPLSAVVIAVVIISVITTISFGGVFYLKRRNPAFVRYCCLSKAAEQPELKSPPVGEVEEVEPYASYVQRVNSIYNSSADLFT